MNNKKEKQLREYDIAIVGSGPAGMGAALYAARANKTVVLFEKECFGGQLKYATRVENYLGAQPVPGFDLAINMYSQISEYSNISFETDEVSHISYENGRKKFLIKVASDSATVFAAKKVIIAAGLTHRKLGLKNEDELIESGKISYCALCDGQFNKGKTVAVIGDGNSALQTALMLADLAEHVYLISNVSTFPSYADTCLVNRVKDNPAKITPIFNFTTSSVVIAAPPSATESSQLLIMLEDRNVDNIIAITGQLFVCIGQQPTSIAQHIDYPTALLSDQECLGFTVGDGYIATEDPSYQTSIHGLFAVGDCRANRPVRQALTAAAEGAIAATAAVLQLQKEEEHALAMELAAEIRPSNAVSTHSKHFKLGKTNETSDTTDASNDHPLGE